MSEMKIEGFPLSPQQRDLWSLEARDGSTPYRCRCLVRIAGPLDISTLRRVLARVVERNEVLSTELVGLPEMVVPMQIAGEPAAPALPELDLRSCAAAEREERIEELWAQAGEWELGAVGGGVVLRAALAILSAREHLLLLALPALCCDAAGLSNLTAEIQGVYAALAGNSGEPEEPLQYIDLAEWQNGIFETGDGQEGVEFWRRQDLAPPLGAPLPFERSAAGGFETGSVPVAIGSERAGQLVAAAAEHGLAPSELLLAGWLVLLRRVSGRKDLSVGLGCDGRNYAELTAALGLFARVVPLALPPVDGLPLAELLRGLRRSLLEARQWQQCFSWERTVSADAAGERPYLPYIFEAWEPAFAAPGETSFAISRREVLADRFHLNLRCEQGGAGAGAWILYDRGRFAAADVAVLADQLVALLDGFLDHPGQASGSLGLLSAGEARDLVERFNDTRRELPGEECVHAIFERWAALAPEAEAVVCEDLRWTYGELNARANRLAHRLRRLGVGAETTVALCVERSAEMIAALLAVLKAGGGYVPLDPALPRERLAYMLRDSAPAVLVAHRGLLGSLPAELPVTVLLDEEDLAAEPADNLTGDDGAAGNLAYVIYTSGSTGTPKGVGVEHRHLRNYVLGFLERAPLPPGSAWATVSTIAADLGNTSVFGALCGGGCLHVVSTERASDPEAFAEYFERQGIDALKLVPSHLKALLQGSSPAGVLPRRQLILGGEPCGWDLVERVRELAPGCLVLNHYGPTETTVGVLTHAVTGPRPAGLASMPLDRPLANSRIHLLDGDFRPVPRWLPGELHVAGAGVARGYLNRPDQTAERFVPDPFSGEPGARLYRTGDLARHLSPGLGIETLGRIDHQVKIRGYRIELGEIGAVLREHAALADALVIAHADEAGEKRLVAYVVPRPEAEAAPADLRRHLAARLPDYMLPAAFVTLAALPLTANGKVDRDALPSPEAARTAADAAPRTAVEEMVAGICAEVLRTDAIGVHDNFFERGGHSLLVARVVSRVRECFGVEISLREFFEAPTAAGLSARVEAARGTVAGLAAPPIERAPRTGRLPLSFSQQRLWFFDQLEPGSSFYNIFQPVVLAGALEPAALERAVGEIVRRHEVLRTTFASVDGEPVQIVGDPAPRPLPLVDLSAAPEDVREHEAARLAAAEARRPFDLGRGPLLRISLVRLAPERHLVLFSMHHVVSDAWSMSLLVRELGELYGAFAAGRPSQLPELPLQYADFALWQRRWLSGEVLDGELAWWRERLSGMPPALEVPTDRPRPAVQSLRGGTEELTLPAELVASLRALSRRQGATLFMTFLAAFKVQLRHHSGRPDAVVGTNVANRDRLETEGLIGFFVNQLVLRTDLSGDPTFAELLARVRKVVLEAVDHQHVPFEKLVEELRPPRDRGRSLLYQFKLEFADGDREALRAGDLAVEPYPFAEPPVRYDLHLTLAGNGPEVRARMLYDSALFDAATVASWLQDFRGLLEAVAAGPEARVGQLAGQLARARVERSARNEEEYGDSLLRKFRSAKRAAVSV
jgi:amino acid adenylation domain-containing protein